MQNYKNIMKRFVFAAAALLTAACAPDSVKSGETELCLDDSFVPKISTTLSSLPLSCDGQPICGITVDGQEPEFTLSRMEYKRVNDNFGPGAAWTFYGESPYGDGTISQALTLSSYKRFPGTILAKASFTNRSGAPLPAEGWTLCRFNIPSGGDEPDFWSFQGQSTEERADWIRPLKDGFSQDNYMGMNGPDYGGGTPVSCIWRRDAGLAIGHLESCPQLVSLPVKMDGGVAYVSIEKRFDSPVQLQDGESLETFTSFLHAFKGDCFLPLRRYSELLERIGIVMPESEPDAFLPAWCAWGYERRFTIDEIVGTLPKVKELGFRWATLDDGYQIAEGDWDLNTERFPRGDADMKYMVDEIHKYGLKADLWWAPFAADPGTRFLQEHPDALILDKDGQPQNISWWDSWYLSPLDSSVREETERLVRKFLGEYGFEGLKLDGQYMNSVPPDYNPAHHPDDPEKVVRELPGIFKLIYDTARGIHPHAVLQYCPCGDCFSVYNLPYTNKTVSSDPLSSWQIRLKGYVLRALAPKTAYYGDHIELSDGGNDYPTQLGIGAVIGTKFTWPKENPRLEKGSPSYLLTPEREALLKNALDIFFEKDLAHAEYVPGLYDIGYDRPETHLLRKEGNLYYAFYTHGTPATEVELRGLESGRRYQLTDYYNHIDLGTITAGESNILPVQVDGALLLEAKPVL